MASTIRQKNLLKDPLGRPAGAPKSRERKLGDAASHPSLDQSRSDAKSAEHDYSLPDTWARPPRGPEASDTAVNILGISCFYHDSAACLLRDGKIVAAAGEERFSRKKNDRRFPGQAINYCLEAGSLNARDLNCVVYYDNAELTFERLLRTVAACGPDGHGLWRSMLPGWLRTKLRFPDFVRQALRYDGPVLRTLHHRAHAASAYYPSPFEAAGVLTMDGVGEWATATIGKGKGAELELVKELRYPHSVGLLYSAFTQFTHHFLCEDSFLFRICGKFGVPG